MKVFVAGSTGALGLPLVRALRAAGHTVVGLTRSEIKRRSLEEAGAEAVIGDVLDAARMKSVVADASPDALVEILNALPKAGPRKFSDLEQTNLLRIAGTRNLLAAAGAAGVRRFVAESMIFGYGGNRDGRPFTEDSPFAPRSPVPEVQPALDALRSLEGQVMEATRSGAVEGIVLRFGLFYGPSAGSSAFMVRMLKRRMLPLPGGGTNRISLIQLDDAAAAVVAALERGEPGGVYNIADDEPVTAGDYLREVARVVGARPPLKVPRWVARLGGRYVALMSSGSLTVANDKAKRELGWTLRYPTYREGAATLAPRPALANQGDVQ